MARLELTDDVDWNFLCLTGHQVSVMVRLRIIAAALMVTVVLALITVIVLAVWITGVVLVKWFPWWKVV